MCPDTPWIQWLMHMGYVLALLALQHYYEQNQPWHKKALRKGIR
jgi:hypothetical protein